MFFALGTLNATGREMDLANNAQVVGFFASFNSGSYLTILLFLLIGAILTCIAQSSAALMAITMVLCTTGVLTIYQGIALVMGENIGTTLTANVAALSANTQARRAALAHLVFNVFGVLWVLCIFYPFVRLACRLVGVDADADIQSPERLSFVLATFHTLFNLTNTLILIWFVPQIEKLVCRLIKRKESEDEFRLKYIQGGIMKTPEISVYMAQQETISFARRMHRMFGMVRDLTNTTDEEAFQALKERIAKYERISDNMENEIGKYLGQVSNAHLSDDTKQKIRSMLRAIDDLESIGDSCYNMARTLERRRTQQITFKQVQTDGLEEMYGLLEQSLAQMVLVLQGEAGTEESTRLENAINQLRDRLREGNMSAVDEHDYSYACSTAFMDLVAECEKCGDYVINVIEAKFNIAKDLKPTR